MAGRFSPESTLEQSPSPYIEKVRSLDLSIGITGENHAAGSSTVAKLLAKELNRPYVSAGGVLRRMASLYCDDVQGDEQKLDVLGEWLAGDGGRDARIDRFVIGRANRQPVVFEGKEAVALAKRGMIPDRRATLETPPIRKQIFAVRLKCSDEESATRALIRDWLQANSRTADSLTDEEISEIRRSFSDEQISAKSCDLKRRMEEGQKRWQVSYDAHAPVTYDLEIDTTYLTPRQVVDLILESIAG